MTTKPRKILTPTLEALCRAAVACGFPSADVRFGRQRLQDLTGPQRADLLDTIQAHAGPLEPPPDDPPRPVTVGQRERLHMLAGEFGWTAGQLDRWIRHARPAGPNVVSLADVTIASQAAPIIERLEAVARDKRRRRQAIRQHADRRQAAHSQTDPAPSAWPTPEEQPEPQPPRSPFDGLSKAGRNGGQLRVNSP